MNSRRMTLAAVIAAVLLCITVTVALGEFRSGRPASERQEAPNLLRPRAHDLGPRVGDGSPSAVAAPSAFPARGDDTTSSLGTFRIFVNPAFQPLLAGYPGYSVSTGRMESPVLYDPATVIGRSDPFMTGSLSDTAGLPVGTAGTVISESLFTLHPDNFHPPTPTREVHTQIRNFDLAGFGAHVRSGATAPLRPISPGEVRSKSTSGLPPVDFPAESFFDIFVEVDLPAFGLLPTATLYNPYPLLVQNDNLTNFPPKVVYIHGNTRAVPILFLNTQPGKWEAGQLFGWLVLAGHALDYSNTLADMLQFQQYMATLPEMPLPCDALDFNGNKLVDNSDRAQVELDWPDQPGFSPRHDVDLRGFMGHIRIDDVQRLGGCQGALGAGLYDPLLIPAGDDAFTSPPFQSFITVSVSSPITPGFFGTKGGIPSDPFSGTVFFGGTPLITPTAGGFRDFLPLQPFSEQALFAGHGLLDSRQAPNPTDTLVRRLSGGLLGDPGGPPATVPIQIVGLSLQSVNPIQVTYGMTNAPTQFLAFVNLAPGTQPQGTITVSRSSGFGGVFSLALPVQSRMTFQKLGPPGTDQASGPLPRSEVFYSGMGTSSPLGPGRNTGIPVPWIVTPTVSGGSIEPFAVAITPTVSVLPLSTTVVKDQVFTVSVVVSSVTNLGAFEFTLAYSPTLVQVLIATLPAAPFLGSTGRTVGVPPAAPVINNTQGTVVFGAFSTGATAGSSGGGVLAHVRLKALAQGISPLSLLTTAGNPLLLTDPAGSLLGAFKSDAAVQINGQIFLPVVLR